MGFLRDYKPSDGPLFQALDRMALTSEAGAGRGRFHIGEEDDLSVPAAAPTATAGPGSGSAGKGAFLSIWMTRLGGGTRRRGSVGFNEQVRIK